jgi:hypothetical protein
LSAFSNISDGVIDDKQTHMKFNFYCRIIVSHICDLEGGRFVDMGAWAVKATIAFGVGGQRCRLGSSDISLKIEISRVTSPIQVENGVI